MISQLPRTAAALLELDLAYRTSSPLDPILRGKKREVIAPTNRCQYSEASALADARRWGMSKGDIRIFDGDPTAWPGSDRELLESARLYTLEAPTIPDILFATLRERFGEKPVGAMVLLVAHENFRDRIVLGLNVPTEDGGPLAPLRVRFDPGAYQATPVFHLIRFTGRMCTIAEGRSQIAKRPSESYE